MRRLWRNGDELEARLREIRAEPRPDFLHFLTRRLEGDTRVRTRRLAFAAALTTGLLVAAGASGGIGYASSATKALAHAIVAKGKPPTTPSGSQKPSSPTSATPASDQYAGKTTICHRTGSRKHPFVVITVSNNALPAHRRHGDTLAGPGGTCPGGPIP
jgi:hypothetical protein